MNGSPEVVGSQLEDLVDLGRYSVSVVCVCQVISRGISHSDADKFAQHAEVSNIILTLCWLPPLMFPACVTGHFFQPEKGFYLDNGVHLNPAGQYHLDHLYRSYTGAIQL